MYCHPCDYLALLLVVYCGVIRLMYPKGTSGTLLTRLPTTMENNYYLLCLHKSPLWIICMWPCPLPSLISGRESRRWRQVLFRLGSPGISSERLKKWFCVCVLVLSLRAHCYTRPSQRLGSRFAFLRVCFWKHVFPSCFILLPVLLSVSSPENVLEKKYTYLLTQWRICNWFYTLKVLHY